MSAAELYHWAVEAGLSFLSGRNEDENGPEMTAKIVRQWLASVGAKTLYIASGSPW